MPEFEFEVSNLIKVRVCGKDAEAARMKLIENLEEHEHTLMSNCVVSDGVEVQV